MKAKPLFTLFGFWNGEPKAIFTACIIKPYENKERPMHWYNPFAGQEMQGIEITYGGTTWIIYNQDGTGFYKVTDGGGSPQCGHMAFDAGYEFVRYIPQSEMIVDINEALIKSNEAIVSKWQQERNPAEYQKLQDLKAYLTRMNR